jgi:hypothetical protein
LVSTINLLYSYESQEEIEQFPPSPTPSKPVTPMKRAQLHHCEESDSELEDKALSEVCDDTFE